MSSNQGPVQEYSMAYHNDKITESRLRP